MANVKNQYYSLILVTDCSAVILPFCMNHCVTIENLILNSQDEAKLLGVMIDKELTLNSHVDAKCKQARSKLANLLSVRRV